MTALITNSMTHCPRMCRCYCCCRYHCYCHCWSRCRCCCRRLMVRRCGARASSCRPGHLHGGHQQDAHREQSPGPCPAAQHARPCYHPCGHYLDRYQGHHSGPCCGLYPYLCPRPCPCRQYVGGHHHHHICASDQPVGRPDHGALDPKYHSQHPGSALTCCTPGSCQCCGQHRDDRAHHRHVLHPLASLLVCAHGRSRHHGHTRDALHPAHHGDQHPHGALHARHVLLPPAAAHCLLSPDP
mmetsp:Transcript_18029/g.38767  ORF Transcript_18029/g.38767 Transcript_18029/m.38767 type:complete len:241 (+) Transcript_18029:182-904(+)